MEGRKLKDLESMSSTERRQHVHVARVYGIPIKILRENYSLTEITNKDYSYNTFSNINILRKSVHHFKRRGKTLKYSLPAIILSFAFISVAPFNLFFNGSKISQIKAEVTMCVERGIESMKAGGKNIEHYDFDKATGNFNAASRHFQSAIDILNRYGQYDLSYSYSSSVVTEAGNLLLSAELINKSMLIASDSLRDMYSSIYTADGSDTEDRLGKLIKYLGDNRGRLARDFEIIDRNLSEVENKIAQANSNDFSTYQNMIAEHIPTIRQNISSFKLFIDGSADILGYNGAKKFLILFLNNAELRPGGGFIGSYATTELTTGSMSRLSIDTNIIKRDHTFGALYNVNAPYPLSKVSKEWYMRDSNWNVNYNDSAKTTAWFYQQEGGPIIDMIISIDSTFISNLLLLTGPIKLDDGSSINDQNFNDILTYSIENKYWQNDNNKVDNEPKTVIKEIYPILLYALYESIIKDPINTFEILKKNYRSKHLNFSYSGKITNTLEKQINDINMFNSKDFIMINNANTGGLKSSISMKQSVNIEIEPKINGDLYHRVEIKRTHTGTNIWPDGENHNYLRIAVPQNASLISAISNGDENGVTKNDAIIEEVNGYKTFGLWLTTKVSGKSQAIFEYKTTIPNFINQIKYNFMYYKQSGSIGDQLSLNIFGNNKYQISNFVTVNKYSNTDELINYSIRK